MSEAINIDSQDEINIYSYLDYREFLTNWLNYLKKSSQKLTAKKLSLQSGLSQSFISMVLSGKRSLSVDQFEKLAPHILLSQNELKYLYNLVVISDGETQEKRVAAFESLKEFSRFNDIHHKDLNAYKYLKAWYYLAIREMARLPNFKTDPIWIRANLKYPVTVPEIREAIYFLLDHNFIEKKSDGRIRATEEGFECHGGIFRLAMSQFHKQILKLANESIFKTHRDERDLVTQTIAIRQSDFDKVKEIFLEAHKKIGKLNEEVNDCDKVYQISSYAFPLTAKDKDKGAKE